VTVAIRRQELRLSLGEAGFRSMRSREGDEGWRKEEEKLNALQEKFNLIAENLNTQNAEPIDIPAIFGDVLTEVAGLERKNNKIPCFVLLNRVLIALGSDVRYQGSVPLLNDALTRVQALALQAS